MEKRHAQKMWQTLACLACVGVLWIHLDDFGASEFSGGRITGKLFAMADLASLLLIVAVLVTVFSPRIAAVMVLTASLLCLPFYLYLVMPGPFRPIFEGEYSVPLHRPVVWDTWAVLGILSLLAAGAVSARCLFKVRARA